MRKGAVKTVRAKGGANHAPRVLRRRNSGNHSNNRPWTSNYNFMGRALGCAHGNGPNEAATMSLPCGPWPTMPLCHCGGAGVSLMRHVSLVALTVSQCVADLAAD